MPLYHQVLAHAPAEILASQAVATRRLAVATRIAPPAGFPLQTHGQRFRPIKVTAKKVGEESS